MIINVDEKDLVIRTGDRKLKTHENKTRPDFKETSKIKFMLQKGLRSAFS